MRLLLLSYISGIRILKRKKDFAILTRFSFLQLMSVFPAASRSHVPRPWADLMIDPECTIIDFYPEDFKIDLNGKKYAWQGVALLPFVDEVNIHLLNSIMYQS